MITYIRTVGWSCCFCPLHVIEEGTCMDRTLIHRASHQFSFLTEGTSWLVSSVTSQVNGLDSTCFTRQFAKESFKHGTDRWEVFSTSSTRSFPIVYFSIVIPWLGKESAFYHLWDYLDVYTFLLFTLILLVLDWMLYSNFRVTLVALCWSQQEWYLDLLSVLMDEPREFL